MPQKDDHIKKANYILEIYKDRKKEFRFRLLHKNGNEIFKSSEGYKRKTTMKRIIDAFLAYVDVELNDLTEK